MTPRGAAAELIRKKRDGALLSDEAIATLVAEERAVSLLADQLRRIAASRHTPSNTSHHSSSISG